MTLEAIQQFGRTGLQGPVAGLPLAFGSLAGIALNGGFAGLVSVAVQDRILGAGGDASLVLAGGPWCLAFGLLFALLARFR